MHQEVRTLWIGYLMGKFVAEQVREHLGAIGISDEWAEKMLEQIEQWAQEERRGSASFAQNLETRTKELETKMDKLVSAYLDGEIEKGAYLKKKEELMKIKADLHSQRNGFGQKPSWIEPLRDWVKTAHHAGKLASCDSDFNEIKSLAEKIGTNRLLRDKKILFDFVPPYHNIPTNKALQSKSPAGAGLGGEVSKKETLAWWSRRELNPRPNKETISFLHA